MIFFNLIRLTTNIYFIVDSINMIDERKELEGDEKLTHKINQITKRNFILRQLQDAKPDHYNPQVIMPSSDSKLLFYLQTLQSKICDNYLHQLFSQVSQVVGSMSRKLIKIESKIQQLGFRLSDYKTRNMEAKIDGTVFNGCSGDIDSNIEYSISNQSRMSNDTNYLQRELEFLKKQIEQLRKRLSIAQGTQLQDYLSIQSSHKPRIKDITIQEFRPNIRQYKLSPSSTHPPTPHSNQNIKLNQLIFNQFQKQSEIKDQKIRNQTRLLQYILRWLQQLKISLSQLLPCQQCALSELLKHCYQCLNKQRI